MEVRVLRYFLTVAREENITKAADVLHITQPTLSRQLAQLEEEVGVKLFSRGSKNFSLTNEGYLLRRRAEEILELVDKTEKELAGHGENVEGNVSIGCGDLGNLQVLSDLIQSFHLKYPAVTFDLYTATAEHVKEQMERGLIDIGLLLEPIDMVKFEFIRLKQKEEWVVAMHPESPLAELEHITAKDLKDQPLILPHRLNIQSELAQWFGSDYDQLQRLLTSNLPSSSSVLVHNKLAYSLIIKGSVSYWDAKKITYRPLYPELLAQSVIAWKRQQPFSLAAEKFIEHIRINLAVNSYNETE